MASWAKSKERVLEVVLWDVSEMWAYMVLRGENGLLFWVQSGEGKIEI